MQTGRRNRRRNLASWRSAALTLAAAFAAAAAHAQDQTPPTRPPAQVTALPEVIVRATKVPRPWLTAPHSVSVVEGSEIEQRAIDSSDALAQQLPNVYFTRFTATGSTLSIRGLGFADDEADARSGGVVLDGVNIFGLAADSFFDLERVELVRGPQSLYGMNSQAGLLLLHSRPAGAQHEGFARLEAGTGERALAVGAGEARAGEATDMRVALRLQRATGDFEDILSGRDDGNAQRRAAARLKLLQRLGGGVTLDLGLHAARQRDHYNLFAPRQLALQHRTATGESGRADADFGALIARVDAPLPGDLRLTSLTGWVQAEDHQQMPRALFAATTDFRQNERRFSQELRLSGGVAERSEWLVGLHLGIGRRDTPNLFDAAPFFRSATDARVDTRVAAVFAQTTQTLAPRWTLGAALRLEDVRRRMDWRGDAQMMVDTNGDGIPDTPFRMSERIDDLPVRSRAVLPSLSISYALAPDQRLYASVARGYRPAGFNIHSSQAAQAREPYDEEWATQAEVGWRGRWQGRLQWSITAFHIRLRDHQVVTFDRLPVTRNAARSTSSGAEAEAWLLLAPQLQLGAHAGTVSARFEQYFDGRVDRSGQQFPNTPRYSAGASLRWQPAAHWDTRLSVSRIGGSRLFPDADQFNPAYTLVDASVSLQLGGWELGLIGKNLLDETYFVRALRRGLLAGPPRTVSLYARTNF